MPDELKEYTVEITETLQRQIHIKASSGGEAISEVKRLYNNEEIILDSSDYIDTDFKIINFFKIIEGD